MPKILYLVTADWFFVSHFLPMARTAREAGFDVVIAARTGSKAVRIDAEGFRLVPLDNERGSMGLAEALRYVRQAYRIIRAERPDVVHCIALRPLLLGGIAAKFAGVRQIVLAPTGLGHLWTENSLLARLVRMPVRAAVAWLRGPRTWFLFENRDDPREFGLAPDGPQVVIVGGAGVDPNDFPVRPEAPAPPVRLAVVARMIRPKGIAEAVEATRRARALGAPVVLDLYGDPDPDNRLSIDEAELRRWSSEPGIRWHGRTDDVARVWHEHHIALCLTYYREGLPRSLIEAAAAGRPIVTTDIAGCRELVRDGREGFVVPPHDIDAAARAVVTLAGDAALRARMGAAANARFHERFTEAAVTAAVRKLYESLLPPR
jgi:glycosyltransferase involved in cell wall biosynthesis